MKLLNFAVQNEIRDSKKKKKSPETNTHGYQRFLHVPETIIFWIIFSSVGAHLTYSFFIVIHFVYFFILFFLTQLSVVAAAIGCRVMVVIIDRYTHCVPYVSKTCNRCWTVPRYTAVARWLWWPRSGPWWRTSTVRTDGFSTVLVISRQPGVYCVSTRVFRSAIHKSRRSLGRAVLLENSFRDAAPSDPAETHAMYHLLSANTRARQRTRPNWMDWTWKCPQPSLNQNTLSKFNQSIILLQNRHFLIHNIRTKRVVPISVRTYC